MTNADRLSKAIMALGEFDHEEFSDLKAEYAIKFVDEYAEWLIQQAERAEILKQRNKRISDAAIELQTENKRYKRALNNILYSEKCLMGDILKRMYAMQDEAEQALRGDKDV